MRDKIAALASNIADGKRTLAAALEAAYQAGYEARGQDEIGILYRADPPMSADRAKAIYATAASGRYPLIGSAQYLLETADRVTKEWTWQPETACWLVTGDDCMIRPGIDGLCVMEAATDCAGIVIAPNGITVSFPQGTFR